MKKNTDIDCGGKSGSVIAIGTTHSWLLSTIKVCNKLNITIIVSGCKQLSVKDVVFSSVSSVREESLMVLKNYLSHYGKKRIALYAINQNSDADVYLAENVYSLMKFKGTDIQIIYNNETSLNDCFERLLERIDSIDTVICSNDYAALQLSDLLKRYDKAALDRIFIISFNNFILSSLHSPSITSFSEDNISVAKALVEIYQLMLKSDDFLEVHIKIRQHLNIRESTHYLLLPEYEQNPSSVISETSLWQPQAVSNYFEDELINRYNRVEGMLERCDKLDFMIIKLLMRSCSIAEISKDTFTSIETVKYRLRKIMRQSYASSKKELIELIKTHIIQDKLEAYCDSLK